MVCDASASLLTRSAGEEIAALQAHLELLKALGCRVFILAETSNAIHCDQGSPLSATPRLADSAWPEFGRKLSDVADYLSGAGLRMAYHHHLGTVVESQPDLARFLESTGASVGLTLDTGHAALPLAADRRRARADDLWRRSIVWNSRQATVARAGN